MSWGTKKGRIGIEEAACRNLEWGVAEGRRRIQTPAKETDMKWQTPQACDMRFGFEITMYIATR